MNPTIRADNLASLLDVNLNLLKLDLQRSSQAKKDILAKIIDIENPTIGKTIEELKNREKNLQERIESISEEKTRLENDLIKTRVSNQSLRRSAITIIIASVIITGISLIYVVELSQSKTTEILDQKHYRLESIAINIESEILDLQSVIEASSKLPQVQDTSFANLIDKNLHGIPRDADVPKRSVADDILATNNDISAVFFTLPNGDMYLDQPYHRQENLISSNFAFRDWYAGISKTQKTYVSEIFVSQGANERAIAIVTPIHSDNEYVGIFGAILDIDHITAQFEKFKLGKNEQLIIVDQNGNTIHDSKDRLEYNQVSRFTELPSKLVDGKSSHQIKKINGVDYTIFVHPIHLTSNSWSAILIQPYEDTFEQVRLFLIFSLITLVSFGTISFGLCIFILRTTNKTNRSVRDNKIDNKPAHHYKNRPIRKIFDSKQIIVIAIVAIIVLITFNITSVTKLDDNKTEFKGKFIIENLRGDTIDTWVSWRLAKDESLQIRFLNSNEISEEQLESVKEAISSNESILVDDSITHKAPAGQESTYYVGWSGALNSLSAQQTKFNIPTTLEVSDTVAGEGDIVFHFTRVKDVDGYSGYTKSITDENQILKSTITIYDVESLSPDQIAAITRHEFGHALGLAHSTAPEDLMAPIITTTIPYISECDVDAIQKLYDGVQNSQVICEK